MPDHVGNGLDAALEKISKGRVEFFTLENGQDVELEPPVIEDGVGTEIDGAASVSKFLPKNFS